MSHQFPWVRCDQQDRQMRSTRAPAHAGLRAPKPLKPAGSSTSQAAF